MVSPKSRLYGCSEASDDIEFLEGAGSTESIASVQGIGATGAIFGHGSLGS